MRPRFLVAPLLLVFLSSAAAHAVTIDFESGSDGVAIGNDYSGLGVVFENAFYVTAYGSQNGSSVWVSGETSGEYNGVGNVVVSGHFVGATGALSAQIIWADFASTTSILDVYDGADNLIGTTSLSNSTTPYTISIAAPGIHSFAFRWTGGGSSCGGSPCDDVIGIDNLTFEASAPAVPEPGTLVLLGSGLAGIASALRRKRSAP